MANILEKTLNFGLGLALYSKEKIESIVDEMVDKGEIAKKDAREFSKTLIQKGEYQRDEIKKLIREEIESVLGKMSLAQKKDLLTREDFAAIVADELAAARKPKDTPPPADS